MTLLPKTERVHLMRTLKDFAFEQAPQFKNGFINGMDQKQTFYFIEQNPGFSDHDSDLSSERQRILSELDIDETRITLGFYALRHSQECGGKPLFSYELTLTSKRLIHPRALKLSDDAWEALAFNYFDEENEADMLAADAEDGSLQEQIIEEIIEANDACEEYQSISYNVSTAEPVVYDSYERGVYIGGDAFDQISSDDQLDYEKDGIEVTTAEGETHHMMPKVGGDQLPIGDEIETEYQFLDIIRSLGLDNEANEYGLGLQKDKMAGLLFVLECMKKRQIAAL